MVPEKREVQKLIQVQMAKSRLGKRHVNGAVMAANASARTFFSLLLIYAVSNVYFQTKTSETFI